MRRMVVVAFTVWMFGFSVSADAAGLLKNADFSRQVGAGKSLPASWHVTDSDNKYWTVVDDDGYSDNYALRYLGREARNSKAVRQEVACLPNSEYVLVAYLKSDGSLRPMVRIIVPDASRKCLAQVVSDGRRKWTRFIARFNSGGAKHLAVEILASDSTGKSPAQDAPAGIAWIDDVQIVAASDLPMIEQAPAELMPNPPGENIALGCPYRLDPPPNYPACTDPADTRQLTDGEYSAGYFWTQESTVGWTHTSVVQITIDLGQVRPIRGLSFSTAAGRAGVDWPQAIQVQVSEDGNNYFDTANLVKLNSGHGPPQARAYRRHRFWTDQLATHGRYLRMIVSAGSPFIFGDEIEVYRGPSALLADALQGERISDADQFFRRVQVRAASIRRVINDAQNLRKKLLITKLPVAERQRLEMELDTVTSEVGSGPDADPDTFRAILPLNEMHARLFRVQAALWRTKSRVPITAWQSSRWDPSSPTDPVPRPPGRPRIEVAMMQHEYRSGAFNLSNALEQDVTLRLRIEKLPGGPNPPCAVVHEVAWTDTQMGIPVADAMPEAKRDGGDFLIRVPSGMTRQVWLTFHPTDIKPGTYDGSIIMRGDRLKNIVVPLRLRISSFRFPASTTLHLGGWDYTDAEGHSGITPDNRDALITLLREHLVDTPWATSAVMPNPPDFDRFDAWVKRWSSAPCYRVFLNAASSFAGAEMGTQEFDRLVGAWISTYVKHMRELGLRPNQLGLLILDEPSEPYQDNLIIAWAKAIHRAEPEVLIWEDPGHKNPALARAMMEVCDVLCVNRPAFLAATSAYREVYAQQRAAGRTLNFYSFSGPVRLLDPYSYHRLQAWTCWKEHATAEFFWAFSDNGGTSAWNEYTAKGICYTPLFLDDRSVTTAKHMEAVREGVEDYQNLVILRDRIAELDRKGEQSSKLKAAKKLLANAADRVLNAPGANKFGWAEPKDRTLADRVRVEILDTLEALGQPRR